MRLSPSALNDHLACRYLTWLEQERAAGRIALREIPRPDAELVKERGLRHEEAFRQALIAAGKEIVTISDALTREERVAQTRRAMREGPDVIYQAAFVDPEGWTGYADFLLRTPAPSDLGGHSYEAYDTKLAKHPKPYFVFQLAFYTEQIAAEQGWMPEHMHVALGDGTTTSYAYADFAAYVHRVRDRFAHEVRTGFDPPYPYPVEHCAWCRWWRHCNDKWRADDHLSRVASLGRQQGVKIEATGVHTLRGLAALPADAAVPKLARHTLDDLRLQAGLQAHTEDTGEHTRVFLPLEDGRGFLRLPAPSPGDVFFDIEGDPYWGDEGLEYLLGTWTAEGEYRALWAHDEDEERRSFEAWIDWITARLRDVPDLHVYHYNHYEPTTLKKLMSRYGTREAEVDDLLRREVFVDLYTVVRQALRVGEPGYSLKHLEAFYPLDRDAEVTEAGGSILAYQDWLESRDQARLDAIAEYNADDCRSTLGLRDWLLDQRAEAEQAFGTALPNRDAKPPTTLSERSLARQSEVDALKAALAGRSDAHTLLADLLEYHRREDKPAWWAYFDRLGRSPAELREEDSEALGELVLAEDVPLQEVKRSYLYPMRFPAQEHKIAPGSAVDPASEAGVVVDRVDDVAGIAWIKRGKAAHGKPLPRAIIPATPPNQTAQQDALRALARTVLDEGLGERAGVDLLLRRPPRVPAIDPDHLADTVDALDRSALFVQGPPGAGKTFTGGRLIVELLRRGRRVGVAATSHKAIHNLLDEVEEVAAERDVPFHGLKKGTAGNADSHYESRSIATETSTDCFPPSHVVQLLAGTAWLFARDAMADQLDVLVIDEAGQVSLADAVAMARCARSVVLLGDPQQLAHVTQGTHPRGSGASVLEHLLGDRSVVPETEGVFLRHTWRMHPDVCAFVSTAMYDGALETAGAAAARSVVAPAGLSGTGVRWLPVAHAGNRQTAPEEADAIRLHVERLLEHGRLVGFPDRATDRVTVDDILVVAPYNAQVRCLRARLPDGARVGTVDKFQGQEAPIVLFSMTSSTGEDVPRGMDFLFSRNRLNVAVSRAQCLAGIVASPALLTATCTTVEQMRLINALCRFADLAEAQAAGRAA